jgi:hypothetical protein
VDVYFQTIDPRCQIVTGAVINVYTDTVGIF